MRRAVFAVALALAGCETCHDYPAQCAVAAGLALGCAVAGFPGTHVKGGR